MRVYEYSAQQNKLNRQRSREEEEEEEEQSPKLAIGQPWVSVYTKA